MCIYIICITIIYLESSAMKSIFIFALKKHIEQLGYQ